MRSPSIAVDDILIITEGIERQIRLPVAARRRFTGKDRQGIIRYTNDMGVKRGDCLELQMDGSRKWLRNSISFPPSN